MKSTATKSDETRAALTEAVNRVVAVSRVHERLHKSHQVGIIAFAEYLEKLCRDIASSLGKPDVNLEFEADSLELPAEQAMSLALIANELVTNAFKHGCAAGAKRIAVTLSHQAETLQLTITDDGAGLSAGAAAKSAGLGFRVIKTLSNQLGATLTVPNPGDPTEFKVAMPYKAAIEV
jgi:two-component sensor histidine kinase